MKQYSDKDPEIYEFKELDLSGTYSYANYLKWQFDERLELIKGKVFEMSPAPLPFHQLVLGKVFFELYTYFKNQPCLLFPAPFDVRFPTGSNLDKDIYTVVQPDITIVCDHNIIDGWGCLGAPDVTVEILSPGNRKKDLYIKHDLYEEFGVKEYWIADPDEQLILKYALNSKGLYSKAVEYSNTDTFTTELFPGMSISLAEVFENPLEKNH